VTHGRLLLVPCLGALSMLLVPPVPASAGSPRPMGRTPAVPAWRFKAKETRLAWYRARVKAPFYVVTRAPSRSASFAWISLRRPGKPLRRWKGHLESALLVLDKRWLVYSLHSPIASGCTLVVYDLKRRRLRWKAILKGIGPVIHSKYRNRINLRAGPGNRVTVFGWESSGKYIEVRDLKTGKLFAHRKVP